MTFPAAGGDDEIAAANRRESRRLEHSTLLRAITPLVVDLGSTLAFYALFAITGDARIAAAAGMALATGQLAFSLARRRPIATLQWASIAVVLVVGTITLLANDARFVLIKAALVYGIIGISMLKRGWMARYIPAIAATHLQDRLLGRFENVWAALLLGTGAINLYLVLSTSPQWAAKFMAIWAVASKFALFAVQYAWCRSVARPAIKAARDGRDDATA
ncbi:MAG: septation protein IspZ [Novosphingobium sp.]